MLLNEQKYNNKNRLYYHGSDSETIDKKKFDLIFLSTDIEYAFSYTKTWKIFICTLKAPLNIFNARHHFDIINLRRIYDISEKEIYNLQHLDWFNFRDYRNSELRDDLFHQIKILKYDGIFNFESEKENKNPSIGLFNKSDINIRKLLTYQDLTKMPDFKKRMEYAQKMILEDIKNKTIQEFERNEELDTENQFNFWLKSYNISCFGEDFDSIQKELYKEYVSLYENAERNIKNLKEYYELKGQIWPPVFPEWRKGGNNE